MKEMRHDGSTRCWGGLLAFTYDLAGLLHCYGDGRLSTRYSWLQGVGILKFWCFVAGV